MVSESQHSFAQQNLRVANRYMPPPGALASYSLHHPHRAQFSAHEGEAELIDLSIAGCKLRTEDSLTCSIYYKLILHLPSYPRPINITAATVRWIEKDLFGVRFTQAEIPDIEHLHHILLTMHHEKRSTTSHRLPHSGS